MKDKNIYIISAVISLIGLTTMYIVEDRYMEQQNVSISDIDESMTGEYVKIEGDIENFNTGQGHLFLELSGTEDQISVVEFDSDTWVNTGETVFVEGYVDLYEGDLQIIAEEIE